MWDWFTTTLKTYPEIAIFLTLSIGYFFGKFTYKGIGLGAVTATLLAGVVIGQIGITISQPLKAFVFLMFLFAVGYAVGPQFVRGIATDGVPQAIFAAMGLSTDAINRTGLPADQSKALLNSMPIAYAVTYMFGTVGSALVIALLGPKLLRINLPAACKAYEEEHGGTKELGGGGTAWHRWEV